MQTKGKKVVVAMSGGVDSSVSAALLKEQGFDVVGAFMKCWSTSATPQRDGNAEDFPGGECSSEEDEYWARRAAAHLGIPFYSFDLVDEYKKRVVDYFVAEYNAGRTPNPDVMCNSEIKFGVFFDKVMATFGADYIATGHYARVRHGVDGSVMLLRGVDTNKDQSYFLYRVGADRLAKTLFPIGEYEKPRVRELAKKFGLPNANKKDSQGICFIGNVDIKEFLRDRVNTEPGKVVTAAGEIVGEHEGLAFYTIGQRKGIGSFGGGIPYYVIGKNKEKNELVVGMAYDPDLSRDTASIIDTTWIGGEPAAEKTYAASIRYRQKPQEVTITKEGERFVLHFAQSQRAVTEGQSAVVYDGDILLGGGIIEK